MRVWTDMRYEIWDVHKKEFQLEIKNNSKIIVDQH